MFEKKFKMNKLANCIFSGEHKLKWDGNFIDFTFTPFEDLKHCGILYSINKKQMQFWQRDFYEKTMTVMHEGALYRLSSSCYDQTDVGMAPGDYPLPQNTIRADSEISIAKMERMADGKIKLVFISKTNLFLNAP